MNRSAKLSALSCCVLAALLACGYHYEALRISRKADFTPMVRHGGLAKQAEAKTDDAHAAAGARAAAQRVKVVRYLATSVSGSPSSRMNDKGVQYALEGRFREAELIFRESLKDDPAFAPACNNIAVVCEIFGRREESFDMYSRACIMEPDNEVFRENFLNLSDSAVK